MFLVILALCLIGCSTPQYKASWAIGPQDGAEYERFLTIEAQCREFAYRSVVAGSKYTEKDIHTSCVQRNGFVLKYTRI